MPYEPPDLRLSAGHTCPCAGEVAAHDRRGDGAEGHEVDEGQLGEVEDDLTSLARSGVRARQHGLERRQAREVELAGELDVQAPAARTERDRGCNWRLTRCERRDRDVAVHRGDSRFPSG